MKWVALLKVLNIALSSSWHSGSAISNYGKAGFDTKEEAEAWIQEKINRSGSNGYSDRERYQLTPCVLSYDESQSSNVEAFFRCMS